MTHIFARSNSLNLKNILMMDLSQTCSFSLHKHDCCLDSHSDGTHWLQRIHRWASDVMLNICSHEETNSSTISDGLRASTFSANFHVWVNYFFNMDQCKNFSFSSSYLFTGDEGHEDVITHCGGGNIGTWRIEFWVAKFFPVLLDEISINPP